MAFVDLNIDEIFQEAQMPRGVRLPIGQLITGEGFIDRNQGFGVTRSPSDSVIRFDWANNSGVKWLRENERRTETRDQFYERWQLRRKYFFFFALEMVRLQEAPPLLCGRQRATGPQEVQVRSGRECVKKLTEWQVRELRSLYRYEHISQRRLGDKFGIAQSTVAAILTGAIYKQASGPIYWPNCGYLE